MSRSQNPKPHLSETTMSKIRELHQAGQSAWLDFIHRGMLDSGELKDTIAADGLMGITSNPSIFEKSITSGNDYDASIAKLIQEKPDMSMYELFNNLAVNDIRDAADEFKKVYEDTNKVDGYVSIEVSPELAHDAEGTVKEALELYSWIDRSNIMIKVPGTPAGLEAIEKLISEGVSVNVTLLFSVQRYKEVVQAHIKGLKTRLAAGKSIEGIGSVASFFISRVDAAVDPQLEAAGNTDLQGEIAIANAQLSYQYFEEVYNGAEFAELKAAGAQVQRLLWASTSTKNPEYSDVLYVDELIAPDTVNTIPPATYDAFKDHGTVEQTLKDGIKEAAGKVETAKGLGIDIDAITDKLEADGIVAFQESFRNLLDSLQQKVESL